MALRSKETALDRHRAVVTVTTTGAAYPTSDDLTGLAEAVFVVNADGGTSDGYAAAVTKTRPADTASYTANDVVGSATDSSSAYVFPNMAGAAGGDVIITTATLEIDLTAVTSGMTSFRLYLYNVTPPSAYVDNAAWDLASGDRASFLGYIDLGTPVDLGSTLYVQTTQINQQFTAASSSLFGYLVTNGTYAGASGTVYKITLHAVGV